jgi:F-type H+-transporting ATPase subunit b
MEIFPNWTVIPVVTLLILFAVVLSRVFFRPMAAVLEERHRKIEGARLEAEEIRRTSEGRIAEFDRKMREARRESDQRMAALRNEAVSKRNQIVSARRTEADKLLADAKQDIRKKSDDAQKQLTSQSEEFARAIASRILKRPVSGKSV